METDEGLYHATPQTKGRLAHEPVDTKTSSNRKDEILALPVMSEQLGVMGKIDVYRKKQKKLIERKYQLKQIYQGQIYFAKMLTKNGAVRLQFPVYEVNNTSWVIDNIIVKIEDVFSKHLGWEKQVLHLAL